MPAIAANVHTEEIAKDRHIVEIGGGHSYHQKNGSWVANDFSEAEVAPSWATHAFTKNHWALLVDVNARKFRICPDRDDLNAYIEIEVPYPVTFNVSHTRSQVSISGHHSGTNADFLFTFSDQGFKKEFVFHEKSKVPSHIALGFRLNGITREVGRLKCADRLFGNLIRPFIFDSADIDEQKYAPVSYEFQNDQIIFDLNIPEMAGAQYPVTLDPTLVIQEDNSTSHIDGAVSGNTYFYYGRVLPTSGIWYRYYSDWGKWNYQGFAIYRNLGSLLTDYTSIVSAQYQIYAYDLWSPDASFDVGLYRLTENLYHLNNAHGGDGSNYSGLNQCVFEAHNGSYPVDSRWEWAGGYPNWQTQPLASLKKDSTYASNLQSMPTSTGWITITGLKDMVVDALENKGGTLAFARHGGLTTDGSQDPDLYSTVDRRINTYFSAYTDDVSLRPKLSIEFTGGVIPPHVFHRRILA